MILGLDNNIDRFKSCALKRGYFFTHQLREIIIGKFEYFDDYTEQETLELINDSLNEYETIYKPTSIKC